MSDLPAQTIDEEVKEQQPENSPSLDTEKKQNPPPTAECKQRRRRVPKKEGPQSRPKKQKLEGVEPKKSKKVKTVSPPPQVCEQEIQVTVEAEDMSLWNERMTQLNEIQSQVLGMMNKRENLNQELFPNNFLIEKQLKKMKNAIAKILRTIKAPKLPVQQIVAQIPNGEVQDPQPEAIVALPEVVPEPICEEIVPIIIAEAKAPSPDLKITPVKTNSHQRTLMNWFKPSNKPKTSLNVQPISATKFSFKSLDQRTESFMDEQRLAQFEVVLNNMKQKCPLETVELRDHIQTKEIEIRDTRKDRRVHLYIFDSTKVLRGIKFNKTSRKITGRNPFEQDEECIDYDLDSEDELQELDAESITKSQKEDEEDGLPDLLSESDENFIVPDGYLSEEEGIKVDQQEDYDSAKENRRLQLMENDRMLDNENKAETQLFKQLGHCEIFDRYAIQSIDETTFPIQIKKQESKQLTFFDCAENMTSFVRFVSGSYFSMQTLSQKFKESHPKCSKYGIEKKLKEIAEKLKKENQKDRWVVKPEALALYGISAAENQELIAEKEVEYQKMRQMKIEKKKSESEKKKGTAESEQVLVRIAAQTDEFKNKGCIKVYCSLKENTQQNLSLIAVITENENLRKFLKPTDKDLQQ